MPSVPRCGDLCLVRTPFNCALGKFVGMIQVLIQRLDSGLPVPSYAHLGDAGADLYSADSVTIAPGERKLVATGIAIALPAGYAAFVHPRSGLALRHGLSVVNTPGTIDAGYRGEIKVLLINHDQHETVSISRGDRIAQLVIQQIAAAEFVEVAELESSGRGVAGYGSSGGHSSLDGHNERGSDVGTA